MTEERAASPESADRAERAVTPESAEVIERPKYRLGYPRIETSSHHLWEAQQANWPDHLPHQAWRALAYAQTKAEQSRGSSADHPAFQPGYVPNYLATEEQPAPEPPAQPGAKGRR